MIQDILEKNRQFNLWKKETEAIIENKKQEIKTLNQTIDLEEFRSLGYKNIKMIWEEIKYNIEYSQTQKLDEIFRQLKLEAYPILAKAHFYPIINDMEFLTDNEKHNLDELLYKLGNRSYIHTCSSNWYNLNFDDNKTQQVLDFLYENNIIAKYYKILCDCRQGGETISEEEYNIHKKYFEIETKLGNEYNKESTATDEEYKWYHEFLEERIWSVGCFECDGRELESWDDFKEYTLMYKVKAIADTTYYNK